MDRDEYVQKLKTQIDKWNAEAGHWEAQMQAAQGKLREEYAKQLEQVKSRREEMLTQMKLLQNASVDAWTDLMRGSDQAWKSMQEAFERARSHFGKK
jgi:hypothetical protein